MERPPPTWIAERRVVLVHPDGTRVPSHIAIGQPYTLAGGDPAADFESHCLVEIDGIWSPKHPMIGVGTLGALLRAVQFVGVMLHEFISRGGRVLDPQDDSDVPLDSLFGPLFHAIEDPEVPNAST